jgi:hypothetical protein
MLMLFHPFDETVWHWFGQCSQADTMYAEVRFHSKLIYQTSFPICAMNRRDIEPERPQRILDFYFKANCNIFKSGEDGSLDSLFESFGISRIEGNIWEAGKDPNDIIFGVSFVAKNQILLNGIHVAKIGEISKTNLAKGLAIKTFLKYNAHRN